MFVASAAPPVRFCNVYGIDMPTTKELKWFTYFGDELHTLRDINDDFTVRVASEREE